MTNQSVGMRLVEGGLQPYWYAVQTKPRHEKKVSYELSAKDIRCFLPVVTRQSQWSDRRRTIEEPLFPGYVFARFAPKSRARIALLQTRGILSLVGRSGSGTPIPEGEIYAIQQIMERRVPVEAHGFLTVGERVRIRGGALDGLEGILKSIKGDQSLIVSIETIQRSISVTISGYDVVPVSNSIRPNHSLAATGTN
ncbi:MAG TPA: UpxY family transcription antiterminator [Candidatus Acidoferrum sp.]|nr:UpxY family transcription antiterminator [Candidatus Acidoferrum sp.]